MRWKKRDCCIEFQSKNVKQKILLKKCRCRLDDNIKMYYKEIEDSVGWIYLAQDRAALNYIALKIREIY